MRSITEPTLTGLETATAACSGPVDMNGRCTFTSTSGSMTVSRERGELNDKTRPSARSDSSSGAGRAAARSTSRAVAHQETSVPSRASPFSTG